ncbi:hypothetical protein B0A52_01671 [Exophiala mesophila]|uniref:Sugar phosphate transporter domain-containing protein n=1 Tax=Exophiala mesophila TaxID=212818 RepID=A0A438NFP9_EXOME|nr:hypothetical protein B0A52_01671 [Exophiala mesophila]
MAVAQKDPLANSSSTTRRRLPHGTDQDSESIQEKEEYKDSNGTVVHSNGHVKKPTTPSSSTSTSSSTLSITLIWAPTLILIFGGCCSNVYTLEALISTSPSSGSLITALQFLVVALTTLPPHLSLHRGWKNLYLKPRSVPIRKWVIYTAYFLAINILNNMAFGYRISIPLHIILRSAGPVTTMAVGRLYGGKRYPVQKVVAVFLLFAGVVVAATSDAMSKSQSASESEKEREGMMTSSSSASDEVLLSSMSAQIPGFALLASALLLSAMMGLYTDDMYAKHGRSSSITLETLFYSHGLSLPFFATQFSSLQSQLVTLTALSSSASSSSSSSFSLFSIPWPVVLLLLNATTQLLCIVGVNRLSAQSSSLTVSMVLNVRKLISLVLSIWLFGNTLPAGVLVGAVVVFIGGGLYALPANPRSMPSSSSAPARTENGSVGAAKIKGEGKKKTK